MGKNKYLGAPSYIDTVLDYLIGALCLEKESKFYLTRQISALPFSPTDFDSLVEGIRHVQFFTFFTSVTV